MTDSSNLESASIQFHPEFIEVRGVNRTGTVLASCIADRTLRREILKGQEI
jgi:hypothetical protein